MSEMAKLDLEYVGIWILTATWFLIGIFLFLK